MSKGFKQLLIHHPEEAQLMIIRLACSSKRRQSLAELGLSLAAQCTLCQREVKEGETVYIKEIPCIG